ncbi:hypothetical protein [Plantibacter flavus]|uniref:hypothetical protein n=1 Tax=Plantibacter TaxID=190323 RepID=UPI003D161822
MTKAATPSLQQTRGTVVNASSIGAHRVDGPQLAYSVAKTAVTSFGRPRRLSGPALRRFEPYGRSVGIETRVFHSSILKDQVSNAVTPSSDNDAKITYRWR